MMMFRFLAFATLALVAICLVLGASIALAVGDTAPTNDRMIEAINPDHRMTDTALVFANAAPNSQFGEPAIRRTL
jgi:hypothetical protein